MEEDELDKKVDEELDGALTDDFDDELDGDDEIDIPDEKESFE